MTGFNKPTSVNLWERVETPQPPIVANNMPLDNQSVAWEGGKGLIGLAMSNWDGGMPASNTFIYVNWNGSALPGQNGTSMLLSGAEVIALGNTITKLVAFDLPPGNFNFSANTDSVSNNAIVVNIIDNNY